MMSADEHGTERYRFCPDWTIAPSEALREWMEERSISPDVLAVAAWGRDRKAEALGLIEDVLARRPLGPEHAGVLQFGTGISATFWLNYEHNYRAGLAAGLTDASDT